MKYRRSSDGSEMSNGTGLSLRRAAELATIALYAALRALVKHRALVHRGKP